MILTFIIGFFFLILALTWRTWLGCINFVSQDRAFLLLLLLIILTAVFFLILPNFYGKLRAVRAGQSYWSYQLWALDLRFFCLEILCSLSLSLGRRSMYRSVFSVILLVKVLAGKGLYLCLTLNSNDLFDQGISTILVLAFFVNQ